MALLFPKNFFFPKEKTANYKISCLFISIFYFQIQLRLLTKSCRVHTCTKYGFTFDIQRLFDSWYFLFFMPSLFDKKDLESSQSHSIFKTSQLLKNSEKYKNLSTAVFSSPLVCNIFLISNTPANWYWMLYKTLQIINTHLIFYICLVLIFSKIGRASCRERV